MYSGITVGNGTRQKTVIFTADIFAVYQKCAGMGLNGLIIQKINENWNDREKKNPGSGLEVLQYF